MGPSSARASDRRGLHSSGAVVLAPRALTGALGRQVLVATGLLGLEPIVGWWMVSSGLADRVEVAQDRLALHLLIAAATFAALIYAAVASGRRAGSSASGPASSLPPLRSLR